MRAYISPYFIRRGKTIFRHNPGYRRVINSTKDFPSRHHSRKWLNMYICYLLLHLPCQQTFGCLSQRIYARCIPINIRSEDITTGSRIGNFHWKAITSKCAMYWNIRMVSASSALPPIGKKRSKWGKAVQWA